MSFLQLGASLQFLPWPRGSGSVPSPNTFSSSKTSLVVSLPDQDTSSLISAHREIFVDESGRRIGVVYENRWLAWEFVPDHPAIQRGSDGSVDPSWGELVAVELGLLTFLSDPATSSPSSTSRPPKRVLIIRSDNVGVVRALNSRIWTTSTILGPGKKRIRGLAKQNRVELRVQRVPSEDNPADNPSRGKHLDYDTMLEWAPSEEDVERMGLGGAIRLIRDVRS